MTLARKPVTPIPFEKIWDLDYMKFMLEASASSNKFGSIACPQKHGTFLMRGNINCMLIAPFGSGKTTQVFNIIGSEIERGNNLTFPGLIGTISREGQLIKGSCMRAGGKLLAIDEAQRMPLEVMDALNSLLEPPHQFKRVMGFKMLMPVKEPKTKRGYYWIRGEENEFMLKSKFSCITSSMKVRLRTSIEQAFFSRFIPVRVKIDRYYTKKFYRGEYAYTIKATQFKGDFEFPEYMKFVDYFDDKFDNSHWARVFEANSNKYGFLIRNLGDLCRLAAFMASRQDSNIILYEDAKKITDKFFDQILYNIMMGPLTDVEYKVLSMIHMKQDQIADDLEISQSFVAKIMGSLTRKGLLLRKKKGRELDEIQERFPAFKRWKLVPQNF